jgi:hypothetical protein
MCGKGTVGVDSLGRRLILAVQMANLVESHSSQTASVTAIWAYLRGEAHPDVHALRRLHSRLRFEIGWVLAALCSRARYQRYLPDLKCRYAAERIAKRRKARAR